MKKPMKKIFLEKEERLFFYVIDTFRSSASISLGKMKNPMTNRTDININQAKYYIDLLVMLKNKTKNNVSEYEEQMLINTVSELKMNFIEAKQSIELVNGTLKNSKDKKKK